MIWKILGLFANTIPAYDKYSALKREYLTHPIHMQLSQKGKTFSEFFSSFLKSGLNFEHIQEKWIPLMASVFLILWTSKNVVRYISKKVPLETTLVQATWYMGPNTVGI